MGREYYKNKCIWITGGSSGIGAELAKELSTLGVSLILTARNESKLQEVKKTCNRPDSITILPCDLSDTTMLSQLLSDNKSLLEKVDIVINNAGISQRALVHETELDVYRQLMEVNFMATVHISIFMLKIFRERKSGQFVTMSSVAGKFGVPERSGYSASKMALHGFFDTLRLENQKSNISVSIICPGFIQTDISKHSLTGSGEQYDKLDDGQKNGMSVQKAVKQMIAGIAKRKPEMYIGSFKKAKLGVFISRHFPGLFRKIIVNTKTK